MFFQIPQGGSVCLGLSVCSVTGLHENDMNTGLQQKAKFYGMFSVTISTYSIWCILYEHLLIQSDLQKCFSGYMNKSSC